MGTAPLRSTPNYTPYDSLRTKSIQTSGWHGIHTGRDKEGSALATKPGTRTFARKERDRSPPGHRSGRKEGKSSKASERPSLARDEYKDKSQTKSFQRAKNQSRERKANACHEAILGWIVRITNHRLALGKVPTPNDA